MKVVILTSVERGLASRCLPVLAASQTIDVTGVVFVAGPHPDRWRRWQRKARKIAGIGLSGALNGYRMRRWFDDREAQPLAEVCRVHGVPMHTVPYLNSPDTVALVRELKPTLALSLGNGFIAPSVYELPERGIVNVHCEILPRFQNASSVIWPLFEGSSDTGLTIHRVSRQIDAGDILLQEVYPIRLLPTLAETVSHTVNETYARVPMAVVRVCEQFDTLLMHATPQTGGNRYTTPSLRQYRQMQRNHQALLAQAASRDNAASHQPAASRDRST